MIRLLAYFKRRHPWAAAAKIKAGLLFDGAPRLLRQIDQLVRRPVRWGTAALLPILVLCTLRTAGVFSRASTTACGARVAR